MRQWALGLLAFAALAASVGAQTSVTIIEFNNENLKQSFRTASTAEAQAIDDGAAMPPRGQSPSVGLFELSKH